MMRKEQILEMMSMELSSDRTHSHIPIFQKLQWKRQGRNYQNQKRFLNQNLGRISTFAFHTEIATSQLKQIAKDAGYKYSLATDQAPIGLHEDFFQIRRLEIP